MLKSQTICANPEKQRISDSYVFRGSSINSKFSICYLSGPGCATPRKRVAKIERVFLIS
jgi:hypothetical protein